jgi:hypothetical protein
MAILHSAALIDLMRAVAVHAAEIHRRTQHAASAELPADFTAPAHDMLNTPTPSSRQPKS